MCREAEWRVTTQTLSLRLARASSLQRSSLEGLLLRPEPAPELLLLLLPTTPGREGGIGGGVSNVGVRQ